MEGPSYRPGLARPNPRGVPLYTILAFAAAACLLVYNAIATWLQQVALQKSIRLFGSFWESGNAANLGRDPYAMYPLVLAYGNLEIPIPEVNLNPPSLLPLLQFLAHFDPFAGRAAWLAAGLVIYVAGAWIIVRTARPAFWQAAWLLLFPAVADDLDLGQIYALLFALGVGAWLSLRHERLDAAAVCLGVLAAIKPNFGIWLVIAFAAGHRRPAIIAGCVSAALSFLPALLYGPLVYQQWFAAVAVDRHFLIPTDISLHGLLARLGAADLAFAPAIVLALWSMWWARHVRPTLYDLTPVALLIAILCSPLAWFHYLLVVVPFAVDRAWRPTMIVAILLSMLQHGWAGFADQPLELIAIASIAAMAPALLMLPIFAARAQPRSFDCSHAQVERSRPSLQRYEAAA